MNAADQALAMLRFNWVHYNNPWCPPWACSDTLLQLKADSVLESEGMAALQKELTEPKTRGAPDCEARAQLFNRGSSVQLCLFGRVLCSHDADLQLRRTESAISCLDTDSSTPTLTFHFARLEPPLRAVDEKEEGFSVQPAVQSRYLGAAVPAPGPYDRSVMGHLVQSRRMLCSCDARTSWQEYVAGILPE